MLSTYLLGTLAALPCVVKALAMPAVLPTTPTTTCLKVVSQNDVSGTPWQIGLTAKGGACKYCHLTICSLSYLKMTCITKLLV